MRKQEVIQPADAGHGIVQAYRDARTEDRRHALGPSTHVEVTGMHVHHIIAYRDRFAPDLKVHPERAMRCFAPNATIAVAAK